MNPIKSGEHRILILGDIHAPFHHRSAISWILDTVKDLRPTHVVQIGDAYDLFSYSKFSRNPYSITPEDELQEARVVLEEIWSAIKRRAPSAICHQLLGNHETRLTKRIIEKLPEIAHLVNVDDIWKFKGVRTEFDVRACLKIGEILFTHGWLSQLGAHAGFFRKSTVCGHTHRGGVADVLGFDHHVFELNAGFLADVTHEALKYTPNKFNKWTIGLGFIDRFGPRFIRFPGVASSI